MKRHYLFEPFLISFITFITLITVSLHILFPHLFDEKIVSMVAEVKVYNEMVKTSTSGDPVGGAVSGALIGGARGAFIGAFLESNRNDVFYKKVTLCSFCVSVDHQKTLRWVTKKGDWNSDFGNCLQLREGKKIMIYKNRKGEYQWGEMAIGVKVLRNP